MRYSCRSNPAHTTFLFLLLFPILAFFTQDQANALGPASSETREFAYARVFSAKIPHEVDGSLDTLEAVAREHGTEEILMFLRSDGPEKQVERWVIRLGSEEYGYPPGLTVKARGHLAAQKAMGALKMKDRTRAATALAQQNARLEWVLPESVRSPLLCDIYEDNRLVAVNTIHERLSPSGKQQWPKVIHIRLAQRGWSIVQVFEYLNEKPDGISLLEKGVPEQAPKETDEQTNRSLPSERVIAKASVFEQMESIAEGSSSTTNVKTEPASFSALWPEWGLESSYDTGWKPRGSPVQFRFEADAAAYLSASVWGGQFRLEYDTGNPNDANLMLQGSGQGDLEINFGVEAKTQGRVKVDLGLREVDFKFNIPYAPNFDFRCYDINSFDGYFPTHPVRVADSIEPQTLYSAPVTGIPKIADVTVNLKAEMEVSAEMWAESITTKPISGDPNSAQERCVFTADGDVFDVNAGQGGQYLALADYDEHLDMQMVLTFYPDVCVEVEVFIYEWDYCVSTFALPWKLASGTIDADFGHTLNFESSYDLVITSSYGAISNPPAGAHANDVTEITLDCDPNELPVATTHTWNDTSDPLTVNVTAVTITDPNYAFDYWILDADAENPVYDTNCAVDFDSSSNNMFHTLRGVFYRAKATEPFPDDRMDKTGKVPTLSWRPGEHADWHDVYFGTDYNDVNDADTTTADVYIRRQSLNELEFDPCDFVEELGDCITYHWRIDEGNDSQTWKGTTWSFRTVGCCASRPWPVDGAGDEPRDVYLVWKEGARVADASGHHLYVGIDYNSVKDADPCTTGLVHNGPLDSNSYQLPENERASLLPATYYWRVDEANDTYQSRVIDPWKGPVWEFAAGHVVVDDFEDYNDTSELKATWTVRLWNTLPTGADIDLGVAPNDPVHGGRQSMICEYDNNRPELNYFSEIQADTVGPDGVASEISGNWTLYNIRALVLQFYGEPNKPLGDSERMYVALQDGDIFPGPPGLGVAECDREANDVNEVNLDLQRFAEQDVNLANIARIYVGFGDPCEIFFGNPASLLPGGTGTVFFDDIRLYPPRCRPEMSRLDGDFDGDCFVDFRDHATISSDWLISDLLAGPQPPPPYHNDPDLLVEYTFTGDANFSDTSGSGYDGYPGGDAVVSGGVLQLRGSGYVDVDPNYFGEANPFDGSGDFSIAIAYKTSTPGILISSARDGNLLNHPMAVFLTDTLRRKDTVVRAAVVCGNYYVNTVAADDEEVNPLDGQWHHAAVTYEAATNIHSLYIDANSIWQGTFDPCIPYIEQDTVRIGSSLNFDFPDVNDVNYFDGDINSVRIYTRVLSPEEVCYLSNAATGRLEGVCHYELISPANIWDYEPPGQKQVNFRDYKQLADNWLQTNLWPQQ
ncbi:MAG TPA: LamG-like jellyroll fold domain-containing protein [Sedimentisphaerales bacterium]|nr:LamG-like jellyroll fold domain-containing protein [Sedimentisphaerales bacterium]